MRRGGCMRKETHLCEVGLLLSEVDGLLLLRMAREARLRLVMARHGALTVDAYERGQTRVMTLGRQARSDPNGG
jgi:hypothetical protein